MLKQQVSRVKKVLTILLAVLFLASLTAAAVSPDQDTGTPASPDSTASPSPPHLHPQHLQTHRHLEIQIHNQLLKGT